MFCTIEDRCVYTVIACAFEEETICIDNALD